MKISIGHHKIPNFRSMFKEIFGPILNYFGFILNDDGIIQKMDGSISITLSGKHLYVPLDGSDFFKTRDSTLLVPFNPLKIREHVLIISNFFCKALSDHFRDEDDSFEYNAAGDLIDITSLIKRGVKNEDMLPATFRGVIYEIWCRDGSDVLGKGVDADGNDIRAIIMCMLDCLSKYSHLVEKNLDFTKIFNYIDKVEKNFVFEIDEAKLISSTNNANSSFDMMTMGDVDMVETEEEPVEESEDDESEENENEPGRRVFDFGSNFDEVELF